MFNKRRNEREQEIALLIEEKDREISELKKKLENSETELEAVNTSTHLGIWKCFYDEAGGLPWLLRRFRPCPFPRRRPLCR